MTNLDYLSQIPITSGNGQTLNIKTGQDGKFISDDLDQQLHEKDIADQKALQLSGESLKIKSIGTSKINEEYQNKWFENMELIGKQLYKLKDLTDQTMGEIAKEQPLILQNKFDFTLKEGKIKVITNDMSDKQKNYLEKKLNGNSELVDILGKLNENLADYYKVDEEDMQGRLKVLKFQDSVRKESEWISDRGMVGPAERKQNYAARFSTTAFTSEMLEHHFPGPISTKV